MYSVTPAFRELFGAFYATWQSVEITVEDPPDDEEEEKA